MSTVFVPTMPVPKKFLNDNYELMVGDYVAISPSGKRVDVRYFIVSEIRGDKYIIHPGSRSSKLYELTRGDKIGKWILKTENHSTIHDWSWNHQRYGFVQEIDINEQRSGYGPPIEIIKSEDATDHRILKEYIIAESIKQESESSNQTSDFVIIDEIYEGYIDRTEDFIIRTKTKLGAIVTYMNYIHSLDIEVCNTDKGHWDQIDPRKYHLEKFESIKGMITYFSIEYGNIMEPQRIRDKTIVDFPGPMDQSHRIKSGRKG